MKETFEEFDRRMSAELGIPPMENASEIEWPEGLDEMSPRDVIDLAFMSAGTSPLRWLG